MKRHRFTHDNPDINTEFQRRARKLNGSKPEVEALRAQLPAERERNKKLVAERDLLDQLPQELRQRTAGHGRRTGTASKESRIRPLCRRPVNRPDPVTSGLGTGGRLT